MKIQLLLGLTAVIILRGAVFLMLIALVFGIEDTLDYLFKKKIVTGPDGSAYMHRWYVFRTRGVSLFIHKFVRSDYDRALHDHPWNFLVIPIWRGYIEHSARANPFFEPEELKQIGADGLKEFKSRRVWPIIGTRFRRAEYRHRVELLQKMVISSKRESGYVMTYSRYEPLPAWSLFFRFAKRRNWGFWCAQGWRPWVAGKPDHCKD